MINNQIILFKFIKTNKNVNWLYISYYYKLSENFIKEFQDEVYWGYISKNQKLSESFIEEFKHKIYWCEISIYQKLLIKFKKILNIKLND